MSSYGSSSRSSNWFKFLKVFSRPFEGLKVFEVFNFLSPALKHFILFACFSVFCSVLQTLYLSRLSYGFLKIDIMIILMAYISVEHFLTSALLQMMLAASLLHANSLAPQGFFYMYGIVILGCAHLLSKFVVLGNTSTQFFSLAFLILTKYILAAIVFWSQGHHGFLLDFFWLQAPSFLATTLFAIPMVSLLSQVDNLFSTSLAQERK